MPFIEAAKSPLYGSCAEQSPACQVYNIVHMFSGSGAISSKYTSKRPVHLTFT
jgi:hypothetical protein